MSWRLEVPLQTISAGNSREHWAVKAKRVKAERARVALLWPLEWRECTRKAHWPFPLDVVLERVAPRQLDEGDNLPSALKAVRDECAKQLGVDDRDTRVRWAYCQTKGPYAVVVTLTARELR